MAFDPALLPPVARSLCSQLDLDKGARTRSAISRAYYALFLGVRAEACRQLSISVDNGVEHGDLLAELYRLGDLGDANMTALAKLLGSLYEARRQADYKLEPGQTWHRQLQKPAFADNLAKQAAAALQRIPRLDFRAMAGRL